MASAVSTTRTQMQTLLKAAIAAGTRYDLANAVDLLPRKRIADAEDKKNRTRNAYAVVCDAEYPVPSVAPDTFQILVMFYAESATRDIKDIDDAVATLKAALLDATKYSGAAIAPTIVSVSIPNVLSDDGINVRVSYNFLSYS